MFCIISKLIDKGEMILGLNLKGINIALLGNSVVCPSVCVILSSHDPIFYTNDVFLLLL